MPVPMLETTTAPGDWTVVLPVVLCLMGAALLLVARREKTQAGFALLVAIAVLATDFVLLQRVLADGPVSMTMGNWLPPFGISFTADVLGAGLALAAAGVTVVVLTYALSERSGQDGRDGYYALVLILLGGVSGAFLTGDLFNLYVWFEVLLIASFGLFAVRAGKVQIDGAVKYAFISFIGTGFFLLSLGLIYGLIGTLNMADIALRAPAADPVVLTAIGGVVLLSFGLKAAAFPVNAWLPASYHTAPAGTSALFAGLLTKVGTYALLRTFVAVFPATLGILEPVIAVVVIATLILGPMGAIAETNLRRSLGFIVIGGIGMVLAGLVLPGERALAGAVLYAFHAILTMAALYLVAGLVEKASGQNDSRAMGGLYSSHPLLAVLFLFLMLGAAGMPPFLGFWPKLVLLDAGLVAMSTGSLDGLGMAVFAAILLNAVLTLIAGSRLWAHIFWRSEPLAPPTPGAEGNAPVRLTRRDERFGLLPALALTALIVVVGLWPNALLRAAAAAAGDLADPARYIEAVRLGGTP